MPTTMTLSETVDLAQKVLDENKIVPASKRVAPTLSPRIVRWYTTAGILDAPGLEGHTAVYGRRHLLQLLYIRQAQATGTPLDKIRAEVVTLSDSELSAQGTLDLSAVPLELGDVAPRNDQSFWERPPTVAPLVEATMASFTASAGPGDAVFVSRAALSPRRSGLRRFSSVPAAALEHVVRVGPLAVSLDHSPSQPELTTITALAKTFLDDLESSITQIPAINPTNQ
jgi:DNA-binding transcriptional MerR regulator